MEVQLVIRSILAMVEIDKILYTVLVSIETNNDNFIYNEIGNFTFPVVKIMIFLFVQTRNKKFKIYCP